MYATRESNHHVEGVYIYPSFKNIQIFENGVFATTCTHHRQARI